MAASRSVDTLTVAGIAPEKQGRERFRTLTGAERQLYRWILRSFGAGTPPGPDALADAASELELEVEPALERLRQRDLVHHETATGEILVAYPFSGRATRHRVRLEGGNEVFAMCAIDALGIAPMLDERIAIASRDLLTGEEIRVELAPDGEGSWHPPEAVVVCGASGNGESSSSCCPALNFFASAANGERWLDEHPAVRGRVISMQDAIEAGRTVFGDLLEEE